MKIYIIFCVPAQIPYLGKFFSPEIWAKMFSANQVAGFCLSTISPEEIDEIP